MKSARGARAWRSGTQRVERRRTKELARGKWRGILIELLGPSAISQKHGPCPICGGSDRYRFDNKQNNGDWFCNVCGVGDGFELLQRALGVDFKEAAKRVDAVLGNYKEEPFTDTIDVEKRREHLNKLWTEASEPEIVVQYLRERGIPPEIITESGDLRGTRTMYDKETGKRVPGMVAMIRNGEGRPVSLHRTYINGDKRKKKLMPPIENTVGCYVRLGIPNKTLVLAEGIETALAGWALAGEPAWATISAHGLAAFDSVPKWVQHVIICADCDASFAGQASAFKLAFHLRNRRQINAEVWMSPTMGFDMNDHLNSSDNSHHALLKWNRS